MNFIDNKLTGELVFSNAQKAFEYLYPMINRGYQKSGTRMMRNIGFYIMDPMDNKIDTDFRKWNLRYAEREWDWYMSKDRSVKKLKAYAPIWDKMHGGDDIVNSNYGFLLSENSQLAKVIEQLKLNPDSRQGWASLFDGKRKDEYEFDTVCTLNLGFFIEDNKLCMDVMMRSNDLWFGFCNDQFCFSKFQQIVAEALDLEIGWYYHFAADLHLYQQHWDR